jgi:hypothetical protein
VQLLSGVGTVPAGLKRGQSARVEVDLLGAFEDHDFRTFALCANPALELVYDSHTERVVFYEVINLGSTLENDTEFIVLAVRLD